ncbi:unnamed protein product [Paramecium primaurelia]|uniref:RBR-type E3 ubiquitin transferase n=1 Tax=Paramecium primaurelia TaxID=5886 RepID=A0A8S1Q6R3_PARPR|nr:unnamed protein product [Paramecium primaurelia]
MRNVKMTRSKSEQWLQNQKLNTIKEQGNQVLLNSNQRDHFIIQMSKSDQLGEIINYHSYQEVSQNEEAIKESLSENQNKDLDLARNSVLQIVEQERGQNTQDAINNNEVQIKMQNTPDVANEIPQGNVQGELALINFDQNSNEDDNNDRIESQPKIFSFSIFSQEQFNNNINNNQLEEQQIQQFDQYTMCPICSSNFEKLVQLLECEHQFCLSCYKEYLEDKIKIAKINNILCLQEGCKVIFSEDIIKQIVNEQRFQQYLVFKRKYEIENDPNKKWCPAIGCDRFIEKDPSTNITQCQCGQLICFTCGQIAHQGIQCEDAIQYDFKQALTKYSIKYCPKCKSHIQKNAGCNHMTCACSFEFCWICSQPYHPNHYKYWSIWGCAIWSNGRFKTSKIVDNPDKMRKIYFAPRLVLFILRGPLLIIKLILKAVCKSIVKPFVGLNKKLYQSKKPKFCLSKCIYFLLAELVILLIIILIFPFQFVFYRLGKEISKFTSKGCAY